MTWVKICGIRGRSALDAAVDAGADAVGFNIAAASPRCVTLEAASRLQERCRVPSFLVCVDLTVDEALAALDSTGADGIQPHGQHALDVASAALDVGRNVLIPIPVGPDGPSIDRDSLPDRALPLYDSKALGLHGGTGRTFDWDLIADTGGEFVLAGGLGVDNVGDAIRRVRPFGVDASSRLESSPGVKDPDTIRAFVKEAKST